MPARDPRPGKLFRWNPEELQSVRTVDPVHPADHARARDREGAVYKIVEEALTNVTRHARPAGGRR